MHAVDYVVVGATGHVGNRVARRLIDQGRRVRVIGRSAERLKVLKDRGAEPRAGDVEDSAFLEEAFRGARAVFLMIPPAPGAEDFREWQERVGESLFTGAGRAGVSRVVTLSSMGAHIGEGTGPILGLRNLEERLDELECVAAVHLRPAFFMENLMAGIPRIRADRTHGAGISPDIPVPMIATRDVADVAATLMAAEFSGKSRRELLGPRDYTMEEATRIVGNALGIPDLAYRQLPERELRAALAGGGASRGYVDAMIEMTRAVNEGRLLPEKARAPESTTPTRLEEFVAATLLPAYRAA